MRIKNFSNYTKLYESRLLECQFFTEQNVTSEDIIRPLEGLITEEFLEFFMNEGFGDWAKDKWEKGKKFAKDIYKNVKDAISSIFGKVVDFFKNFSLSKLIGSIYSKIKEIGSKAWNKIKEALGAFKEFIVGNGLANEDNTPNFGKIWSVLCEKGKSLIDWKEEGVTPDKLKQAGEQIKINEADAHSIGDDEIKYYGMFEKIAHALGIKNARFNGVVSQIMKKGVIGIAIMSILKFAGLASFAALGIGALSPVAMAAIGGMLLMAGLIILAIWVCKPYPTLEDCLSYLHIAFGGNCQAVGIPCVFVKNIAYYYSNNITINKTNITNISNSTSMTSNNIAVSNNTRVDNTNINNIDIDDVDVNTGIGIGDGGPLEVSDLRRNVSKSDLKVGQEYIYTSKKGRKIVKVVSLTHDTLSGKDKKWLTGDDKEREKVKDGYVDVVYQDKDGGYSTSTNFLPIPISKLSPLKNETQNDLEVGQEYIFTNKKGEKRRVKLISTTHDTSIGKDKKWLTGDDKKVDTLEDGYASVIYKNKSGVGYNSSSPEMAVPAAQLSPVRESLKEGSRYISSFEKYNNK